MNKESCLISRATVEDADILAQLGKRTYLQHFSSIWGTRTLQGYLMEHYAPDVLAEQLADTNYYGFLIASIAEKPVGFVKMNWRRHEPTTRRPGAEMEKLYVDAQLTGRGIGGRLLKSSLVLAQEKGEQFIWLQVLADNDDAQRFYRRHGFATVGQVPFSTDVIRTDLVVMIFDLAAGAGPDSQ